MRIKEAFDYGFMATALENGVSPLTTVKLLKSAQLEDIVKGLNWPGMALGAGIGGGTAALLNTGMHPKHPYLDIAGSAIGGAGVAEALTNEGRAFEMDKAIKQLQSQMAQRPGVK